MRNILIAAAAVAASSFSMLASAQAVGIASGASASVDIQLSGTLEKRCEISTIGAALTGLDLEILTAQGTGQLSVRCNYSGSPEVTLASLNTGKLKNTSPDVEASVAYLFTVDAADYNLATNQLVPFTTTVTAAELTATVKDISVKLTETAIVAGDYTDTVTASVVPN